MIHDCCRPTALTSPPKGTIQMRPPGLPCTPFRWLLLAPAILAGCGRGPEYKAEPDKAAAVIEAALSAWKEGKSCDDLRKLSPPIHVADERWHGGATITSYTIGEGKPFGPSTRFEVTLEGPPPIVTKKATYTVSTQPAISIALGD
jgi:hypothetical protein